MTGMMKARLAYANEFGNPAAKRMVSANPKTGMTPEGEGTHYMATFDNYAVPLLQDKGGKNLVYNNNPLPSNEDMRFNSEEDAQYFTEHYKEIAPMMRSFKEYDKGGTVPKYKYVNGKFIPTHAFGDTKVGAGIKNGNMIAPALNIAQGFTDENTNPMLSEALNYGAQGASMGAMFGPWGAAIGGGVGLLGGAVKGYFDKEEQDAKQAQFEQTKRNQLAYASLMGKADNSNLGIKTNTQSLYAQGGLKTISRNHPNPQEEVEGGESAITPNGQNIQFKGPKHNNGGIKTNLPSGTRIFSDRLIYPGK
jgi:hypothetical protein